MNPISSFIEEQKIPFNVLDLTRKKSRENLFFSQSRTSGQVFHIDFFFSSRKMTKSYGCEGQLMMKSMFKENKSTSCSFIDKKHSTPTGFFFRTRISFAYDLWESISIWLFFFKRLAIFLPSLREGIIVTLVTLRREREREREKKGKRWVLFFLRVLSFLVHHHHIHSCCTECIVNLTLLVMF